MFGSSTSSAPDYHALFAAAPTPMLVVAPDAPRFTIVEVNQAYLTAVMRTRDDLIGRGVFEAMPDNPDDPVANGVANLRASLERALAGKRPDTMPLQKYDIPHPGGGFEERWWDPVNTPVLGADGTVTAIIHRVDDATSRVVAEAALRESEARIRALTDNIPSGLVFQVAQGPERRFLHVSQSHEQLTGVPADAVLADHRIPYNLILPEDRPRLKQAEAEALAAHSTIDVELRFRRVDGEIRWCRIISAPRLQPNGSVVWDGIQIDVTHQKAVEAALRDNEARLIAERSRLATLVEHLPVGVIVVDADAQLLLCNPAYRRIVPEAQIPSRLRNARDRWIGYDEEGRRVEPHMFPGARALRGEMVPGAEFLHLSDEGHETWVRVSGVPLFDGEGDIAGALCVVVDIDRQKRTEEHLRDLNETLEERVAARTAELEQAYEQLRQSQKLEAMGQLTGGVSHDFNNLLSPIIGSLDLLHRKGIGGEREQRLITGALQSAERAKVLVQRLLAFARRQPLQPVAVDVGALVTEMADLVGSTTGPQIQVVLDVAEHLPAATADPNQIEMAVLNLCVNARDAMPDGGTIRISVSCDDVAGDHRSRLVPGQYVRLSVADTGTGMDAATLKKAVEPFFSTKGIGRGTGLGLSMVHGLAAQLGGAMTIQSQLGLGTNVDIWLPVSREAALQPEQREEEAIGPAAGTVLLVDDEELVRASTADMLADLGYMVVEAASAAEALQLIDGGLSIDVLVTDHLMPGMTGPELAREVRLRQPDVRILVISGYAELDGIGADLSRLTKPFRQTDLAAKLADLDLPAS